MGIAAILIPPSLDAKQALRLRRFGLAALSYALTTALVAVAWAFDALPASAIPGIAAAYCAVNLAVYAAIRSGFNLRFTDPSLTLPQILAAISVQMYIIYHMNYARDLALLGCSVVFLFGTFHLSNRGFRIATLFTLAAYAGVVNLLMHFRPHAIQNVYNEWMSWLMLAGFLPGISIVGVQVNKLRRMLRESEGRFRSLTAMSSDFYWESDAEHRLRVSGSADRDSEARAVRQAGQIGKRSWEIPYTAPGEAGWDTHRAVLDARLAFRNFEFSRLAGDGSERHFSVNGHPVFSDKGEFTGYRGVGTDITAQKRAEQALRESVEKLRLFADNVPAMTVAFDENLRCCFVNKRFAEFFGRTVENTLGMHLREVVGVRAFREIEHHYARVLQGHAVTYHRTHRLGGGEVRHLEIRLLPHNGDSGASLGCFAVAADITEHRHAAERIQRIAHHDALTGLPNRLLFMDRLNQAMRAGSRSARQFALLYIDLDRFKPVNDTLGHAAGDELLKHVATRIQQQVRKADTVARIGGDEFTVILANIDKRGDAEAVAGKIITSLGGPIRLAQTGGTVEIGASIGIAIFPVEARDANALIKAADAAMYSAKQVKNCFRCFA